ncbi:MAG TPA: hypothetical protein VFY00_06815 [Arenimonas sp.]|nr:hypothetical protein [Arenimonas sp.]
MNFKNIFRTACLSAALLFGANAIAPAGEGLVGTAEANTLCTLLYTYINAEGEEVGVYSCGRRRIERSCERGCPWTVWDYRDEQ